MFQLAIIFAGLFAGTLIVPALTAGKPGLAGRLKSFAIVIAVIAGVWLLSTPATIAQWAAATALLASLAFVSLAATLFMEKARFHPVLAAATAVVISLA